MTPSQARTAGLLVSRSNRQDHFSIHLDWLRACKGNVVRAAVLWAYSFREREDGLGHLELTEQDIRELLFNCWSLPTIRNARRWLIEHKFLVMRRGAHGLHCCRINRQLLAQVVSEEQTKLPFEAGREEDPSEHRASKTSPQIPPLPASTPQNLERSGAVSTQDLPPSEGGRKENFPRLYIGNKNPVVKNTEVRTAVVETASTTEQASANETIGGGDALDVEIAYRTEHAEIPTDPDKQHALRQVANAIRTLPHLEQQKAVLDKLEDLARKIRARKRTDIESWGYVVASVRAWVRGFAKPIENPRQATPERTAAPPPTRTTTPAAPTPRERTPERKPPVQEVDPDYARYAAVLANPYHYPTHIRREAMQYLESYRRV